MLCEISPHFLFYHIYTTEDSKNIGGALCGGQFIIHQEVSSNPSHRNFHLAFYEGDHWNHY